MDRSKYSNPLTQRYASQEMSGIFSDDTKFRTWRRCWIALAESERELGLPIDENQIEELKDHRDDINYELMEKKERELRHDVMAAVHSYAAQCPRAGGIIHLGATSCFVTDNTELIQSYRALRIVRRRMLQVIALLARAAEQHRDLQCLGYTHFQPAQPTTLGKRITLWLQDLMICFQDLDQLFRGYALRGIKGASGTQDSFLKLFDGDHHKVEQLNTHVCRRLGFENAFPVTGQTYPRLQDSRVLDLLKRIAQSAHKFATDFRLMQHLRMVDEPFGDKQVGSSAMAYKKNPMRCERLCSLARWAMSQSQAADQTAAVQWFERSLDDSAGRRLYLPQTFLALDAVLLIYANVLDGFRVYPRVIASLLNRELPFLATETIIMEAVKRGGNRQVLHEAVRRGALQAVEQIKEKGEENHLLELLARDERIPFDLDQLRRLTYEGDFSGRAREQVKEYLSAVRALLKNNQVEPGDAEGDLHV